MIRFHDTLEGKPKDFQPLDPPEVTLYTCGPTVYHYAHIGNFRTFVFEDLLRRFLEFKGLKVKHVMNVTDVDDKTIGGAAREEKTLQVYTSFYTQAFLDDMKTLNLLSPTIQPHATDEIPSMLELIQTLIAKGVAYRAEDGSVYYRVAAFSGYGKLSKKNLSGNISGARVDQDEYDKEEGADFVLWKAAKEGEPSWDSPWGKGRPGWHIECSAMCMRHLGETIDIHAGGEDLVFPHHENEIAQSEASTGKPFVKYWLHAKHLLVNGEKMSKSKGNFFTLRDLLDKGYDPMAIRYALLSVHYRHSLNFTFDGLKEAREVIEKLDNCYFQCLSYVSGVAALANDISDDTVNLKSHLDKHLAKITEWLSDDLNIAAALAQVLDIVNFINACLAAPKKNTLTNMREAILFLEKIDRIFGFDVTSADAVPENIKAAVTSYSEARKMRDFEKSDLMRQKIVELGWLVKDGRPGEPSTVKKIRRVWDIKK
jgi:cysteinyl-tRNA synthetase